jgi:hypothetical protein
LTDSCRGEKITENFDAFKHIFFTLAHFTIITKQANKKEEITKMRKIKRAFACIA